MSKNYKEINKAETETTINVLYIVDSDDDLDGYDVQCALGEPKQEYVKGKSIIGSIWEIPLHEKTKISKVILKANIFEL